MFACWLVVNCSGFSQANILHYWELREISHTLHTFSHTLLRAIWIFFKMLYPFTPFWPATHISMLPRPPSRVSRQTDFEKCFICSQHSTGFLAWFWLKEAVVPSLPVQVEELGAYVKICTYDIVLYCLVFYMACELRQLAYVLLYDAAHIIY